MKVCRYRCILFDEQKREKHDSDWQTMYRSRHPARRLLGKEKDDERIL